MDYDGRVWASFIRGNEGVEIMSLEQSDAFEASIQVGVQFQLDTIYDPVHSMIYVYVNGSQTGTKVANTGIHYNKFGQYVSSSGAGPSTFDWQYVESWSGGSLPTEFPPVMVSPAANATGVAVKPTFTWDAAPGATSYFVTVSTNDRFTNPYDEQSFTVTGTSGSPSTALNPNSVYYWRVASNYPNGDRVYPATNWSFTTN